LRSRWCSVITPSNTPCAPFASFMPAMTFRSIPAAKSFLPLVMTMPLTASSASASSISPFRVVAPSIDSTFIDLPGTSQVITATPSAPFSIVKSVMSGLLTRVR